MPTMKASRSASLNGYNRVGPLPAPMPPATGPVLSGGGDPLPVNLARNPVMISSLPAMATNVDGITKQFYAPRGLPTRRLILPS